jgi:microcystin-dependent protein
MDPFLGQIQAFGFNFTPQGWMQCNGQLLAINTNQALFSLLGTMYGGDGRTTFALPDLRGRSIVGISQGPGLSNIQIGQKSGSETITLNTTNLPPHNHPVTIAVNTANGEESTSTLYLSNHASAFSEAPTTGAVLAGVSSANTGNGLPFSNQSPYLGINYCIAIQGIYPSRD